MRTTRVLSILLPALTFCVAGLAQPFDGLRDYAYGTSRAPLIDVESLIQAAGGDPDELAAVEQRLTATLEADCGMAGKQFCCEQLARVGTAKAVPALVALLQEEAAASMALYALEAIPGEEATHALLKALAEGCGASRVALVNALGARETPASVPALTPLLQDGEVPVALAAADALGALGCPEAIGALEAALARTSINRHPALREAFTQACLLGASRMLEQGNTAQAQPIFERFFWASEYPALREAALRGYIQAAGDYGMAIVQELLWGNVPGMAHVAIPFVREMPGGASVAAFLGNMQPPVQAMVIDALAARGDASALPHIVACFERPEFSGPTVLKAATRAVGQLGGADSIGLLLKAGATHADLREEAINALGILRGKDVNTALLRQLESNEDPAVSVMLIRALAARRTTAAVPVLIERTRTASVPEQHAALEALAVLAGPEAVSALTDAALDLRGDARTLAGNAIVVAAQGRAEAVLAALPEATAAGDRIFLVELLQRIGDDAAIAPVQALLDELPEALGVLADWPTGAAVPALADVFTYASGTRRAEALAGLMRGFTKPSDRSLEDTLALFARLLEAATTPDEYQQLFGALARVGDPRALDLVRPHLTGHGVDAQAATALDTVRRGLYRASASHKNGAAPNAIDGILETRWDTGAAQLGAEWLLLDLGMRYHVSGVTLNTSPYPDGFPGEASLFLSLDGEHWGEPVAKADGSAKIDFSFAPREARFIKVAQTGRRETQLWSVHELTVDAVVAE